MSAVLQALPIVLQALPSAAAAGSIATLALIILSSRLRPHDPRLWHGAWLTLAIASLAAPFTALLPSVYKIVVLVAPANPAAPTAGLSAERLAFIAMGVAVIVLGGTIFLACRLALGLFFALQLARRASPLGADNAARVERVAPGLAAICRSHARLRVPVVVGWRHGWILLPETWTSWPDDRLRAILLHEHAHVVRRDFTWNVVAALHQAIYWWSPLAWVVARRIRFTAELASDREAAGSETTTYTRHLVEAARDLSHSAWRMRILAPSASTDLVARVDALLSSRPEARPAGRALVRVLLMLVAAAALFPMLLQARVAQTDTPMDHSARHAVRHQGHGSH